jgi:hypothetical protein
LFRLAARKSHNLICTHTGIRGAAEKFDSQTPPASPAGLPPSFADARVIAGDLKFHLGVGK